jgi:hypothetical protein
MDKRKTAVEWLFQKLWNTPQDKFIWHIILEEAKEMEKEQQGYSEEDMISFAEFVATHPDKNRNVYGETLHAKSKYDGAERTVDLLEQFKKK